MSSSPEIPGRVWLALLQGTYVAAIVYGVEFTLYALTCFLLWTSRNPTNNRRNLFLIFYTSVISILSFIYTVSLLVSVQSLAGIGEDPPLSFPAAIVLSRRAMVIKDWLCEIINIWRCIVFYRHCRVPSWVVNLVPSVLFLASVVLGILTFTTDRPFEVTSILFSSVFIFSFFIVSFALNILVTILLVLRLLTYRRQIVRLLGKAQGAQYTSIAAMFVESALIQSSFAFIIIISFANAAIPGQIFLLLLSPLQGISTFLILLRVASGKAWSQKTYETTIQLSTIRFSNQVNEGARPSAGENDDASGSNSGHERHWSSEVA